MAAHVSFSVKQRFAEVMRDFGDELEELITNAKALEAVDHDAAMSWPGRFDGSPGSQQIVDRYPQHFTKANTLELQRRRLSLDGKRPDQPPPGEPRTPESASHSYPTRSLSDRP
jgi:hypothetical protein